MNGNRSVATVRALALGWIRMTDPRLHSVHLPELRREQFRSARNGMIAACGEQTLCGTPGEFRRDSSPTLIGRDAASPSASLDCWLADGEFVYPLRIGLNTVGRSSQNDIVLADAYASRRQCAIVIHHDARYELHDAASKNGTFLNGQKLREPRRLHSGDRITVNDRHFVFMARHDGHSGSSYPRTLAG